MSALRISSCIDAQALTAWQRHPCLAHAYGNFNAFRECYGIASQEFAGSSETDWWNRLLQSDSAFLGEVRSRRQLAKYPQSHDQARHPIRHWQRTGRVLTLWVYGPLGVEGLLPSQPGGVDAWVAGLENNRDAQCVVVRLDCNGGSFDLAKRFARALRDHPARRMAIIDNACWSSAVLVASACDRIAARRGSTIMLHNMRSVAQGTSADFHRAAEELRSADLAYATYIALRRKVSREHLYYLLREERFLTAEQALNRRLVDTVIDALPLANFPSLPIGNEHTAPTTEIHHVPQSV